MKKPGSVADALAFETIKVVLEHIAKQSKEERGEVIDTRVPEPEDAENTMDVDFVVALQSGSLTVDRVTSRQGRLHNREEKSRDGYSTCPDEH